VIFFGQVSLAGDRMNHHDGGASGSVNRFFRLLAQSDPTTATVRPGS
jgi:hypothetical protein